MVQLDPERTVVVFGAGATKACGGPLTSEILPRALALREELENHDRLALVESFLAAHFHVSPTSPPEDYPDLPLLLSLIDTARGRNESFGPAWNSQRLDDLREALEYVTFALLEHVLKQPELTDGLYDVSLNPYIMLLDGLRDAQPALVDVISLNYDLIADNVLSALAEKDRYRKNSGGTLADYGCDIATTLYQPAHEFPLLKLHGSLNWLYCPNCHRLELGVAESGTKTVKVLAEAWNMHEASRLEEHYNEQGRACEDCGAHVRALLITPTSQKDYSNPHIARVWYAAARALRNARRAIFVGYSLPHDDVEVVYLLKRGLAHLDSRMITVVEHSTTPMPLAEHPVGRRYRSLFGDDIDWHPEGFEKWLATARFTA